MNSLFKNKILAGLLVLLLVANIISMVVFWMGLKKEHPQPRQPSDYIIKELSLNDILHF